MQRQTQLIKTFEFCYSFQNTLSLIISVCNDQLSDLNAKILCRFMNEFVKCSAFSTDFTEIISISNDEIENKIETKNDLNESDAMNKNDEQLKNDIQKCELLIKRDSAA